MIKIKTKTGEVFEVNKYFEFPEVISNYAELEGFIAKIREVGKLFLISPEIKPNKEKNKRYRFWSFEEKKELVRKYDESKGDKEKIDILVQEWDFPGKYALQNKISTLRREIREKESLQSTI